MRERRLASGVLVRAGHRVLRVAAVPATWEQAVLATSFDVGTHGCASHMTAAALWGFAGVRPGAIELSVPEARSPRPSRGRVHRVAELDEVDRTRRAHFALTTPERTLVDIAARTTPEQLGNMVDQAARDGLLTAGSVAATLDRLRGPGRVGVRRLDAALGLPTAHQRTDSWLERRLLRILAGAGLPAPRTQVVLDKGGGGVARVDACYDIERLVIEVDGHRTHSTRRQRQADAEREAHLVAQGWRVVRFTYEDVTGRPDYVVATVRLLLAA
jgi:very-short-patch-repair endonuclease